MITFRLKYFPSFSRLISVKSHPGWEKSDSSPVVSLARSGEGKEERSFPSPLGLTGFPITHLTVVAHSLPVITLVDISKLVF